jgi:putative integral membrane protein (TIGR02587 family)
MPGRSGVPGCAVMQGGSGTVTGWAEERDAFVRAFAGAFIFGVPLLFTMEMWWIGEHGDAWKFLVFLGVALLANFGLAYVAGFKRETSFVTHIDQAIDAMAVGIVGATIMLLILNQIRPGDPIGSVIGKITLQAIPLSIGASVANQVFGDGRSRQGDDDGDEPMTAWQGFFSDVGATAIGGVFIGASIAPTDEIPMIAAALDYWHLVALVAFSLLLSYGIVFASGFDGQRAEGPFQHPFTETMLAYVVSLGISFVALYLFNQVMLDEPPLSIVEQVIVLSVPTTVGGAAGRLVV